MGCGGESNELNAQDEHVLRRVKRLQDLSSDGTRVKISPMSTISTMYLSVNFIKRCVSTSASRNYLSLFRPVLIYVYICIYIYINCMSIHSLPVCLPLS